MSEKIDQIIKDLKTLTLLEASELVTKIEETFGVDASAAAGGGVVMAAAPTAAVSCSAPLASRARCAPGGPGLGLDGRPTTPARAGPSFFTCSPVSHQPPWGG